MSKATIFTPLDDMKPHEREPFGAPKSPSPPERTVYAGRDGPVCLPTFEIGLVLAGAVSAGAYTAGVLDYLIETLDAWEVQKIADAKKHGNDLHLWTVPPHSVRIKVIAGASAGSLCGALFAVASRRSFEHVKFGSSIPLPDDELHSNPLYRAWVQMVDIRKMLETERFPAELKDIEELLDTAILDRIVKSCLDDADTAKPAPERPYLGTEVRYGFSVGNLAGIPYLYALSGLEGGYFATRRHADVMRFAVQTPKKPAEAPTEAPAEAPAGLAPGWTPDYFRLLSGAPVGAERDRWQEFADAGLASAAFPGAFRAREVEKRSEAYLFDLRLRLNTPEDGVITLLEAARTYVNELEKHWETPVVAQGGTVSTVLEEKVLRFASVDGGSMNNQPFEFARRILAGPLGTSPRTGDKAIRAVILVEPFPASMKPASSEASRKEDVNTRIFSTIPRLLGAYGNQARYDSNDLTLATDSNVYSRFILSPLRHRVNAHPSDRPAVGAEAIASGALRAFGGFLDVRFRHHDFLLGRRNAEMFIRDYFSLPKANELFDPSKGKPQSAAAGPAKNWWDMDGHGTVNAPNYAFWSLKPNKDGEYERLLIPVVKAVGQSQSAKLLEEQPIWPGDPKVGRFSMCTIDPLLDQWARRLIDLGVGAAIGPGLVRRIVSFFVQLEKRPQLVKSASDYIMDAVREHGLLNPKG